MNRKFRNLLQVWMLAIYLNTVRWRNRKSERAVRNRSFLENDFLVLILQQEPCKRSGSTRASASV